MKLHRSALFALPLFAAPLSAQDPDILAILAGDHLAPWRVLGPFPGQERNGNSTGLDTAFIDEVHPDFAKAHAVAGAELRWMTPERDLTAPKVHDLSFLGTDDYDTVYLATTLTATADHEAVLGVGFDDSVALWVNGNEVLRRLDQTSATLDAQLVKVALHRGDNAILLKIVNDRGAMAFALRVTEFLEVGTRWGAGLADDPRHNYRIHDVPVPDRLVMEVGGLLFLPDDSLLVACRRGRIYRLAHPEADSEEGLGISTYAEGLHDPLGLMLDDDGSVLVAQQPELTRLRDRDGDGRADSFETVAAAWGMSGNYHEFHFGPVRAGDGSLWGTLNIGFPSGEGDQLRYRGSAYRVTRDGQFEIECYGLRSPNGLVVDDDGAVFYTDNQGEWMDVCRLALLQPKHFYGHAVPKPWAAAMPDFGWQTERTLPAVWYPYHLMRSTSQPVFDRTGGAFGPYTGQIIVGDQNNSNLVRTTLQHVNGVVQGACYPFWQSFGGGINRLAFDRRGVLYVGMTNRGWGSVQPRAFGLQRFEYVGPAPFDLREVVATADGFELRFTKPLSPLSDLTPGHFLVREYGYHYWSTYGSDEIDSRSVDIEDARLSDDRQTVTLRTGPRNTGKAFQIAMRGKVTSQDGETPLAREAFYTLLQIPAR